MTCYPYHYINKLKGGGGLSTLQLVRRAGHPWTRRCAEQSQRGRQQSESEKWTGWHHHLALYLSPYHALGGWCCDWSPSMTGPSNGQTCAPQPAVTSFSRTISPFKLLPAPPARRAEDGKFFFYFHEGCCQIQLPSQDHLHIRGEHCLWYC